MRSNVHHDERTKVAFLGTGLMGRPMAGRLLAAGHSVTVYNRTREKAEVLRSSGAVVDGDPAATVRSASCVILMLADYAAVQNVLSAPGLKPALGGRTVIQMATIGPRESQELQSEVRAAGGDYFEAPVLGGPPEAEAGKLIVMVGGSNEQFRRWSGLLGAFGPRVLLIGPVGKAAALKLALNQLIASLTSAFALSLAFVERAEIPPEAFMNVLRQSALYAPTFEKKLQRMLGGNFDEAHFPTRLLLKDVNLFMDEARALGLETSSLEGTQRLVEKAMAESRGPADYSVLYATINPGYRAGSVA